LSGTLRVDQWLNGVSRPGVGTPQRLNQLSTIRRGHGWLVVVVIMIVIMITIIRVSAMNFFQLFKLEVTHGCLQWLKRRCNVRLETATNVRVHARPRCLAAKRAPRLGMLPPQKRPVEDEAGAFLFVDPRQPREQAES
jgi:hypothetical protein